MISFIAITFALFVFAMTTTGIINAVGQIEAPRYDIETAAGLLNNIYVKAFGVPEIAASPVSFILLALPAILAFYFIEAIFKRR